MNAHGFVHRYGDNVDTDVIIPARYLNTSSHEELAAHCMEDLDKDFVKNVKKGDIIVAGKNFGCGSSREQAPEVIKALGIRCVIAGSYARIFFRNAINNGLLLIENADLAADVKEGDEITVRVGEAILYKGREYPISPLPQNLLDILEAGGLVKAMQRLNGIGVSSPENTASCTACSDGSGSKGGA